MRSVRSHGARVLHSCSILFPTFQGGGGFCDLKICGFRLGSTSFASRIRLASAEQLCWDGEKKP